LWSLFRFQAYLTEMFSVSWNCHKLMHALSPAWYVWQETLFLLLSITIRRPSKKNIMLLPKTQNVYFCQSALVLRVIRGVNKRGVQHIVFDELTMPSITTINKMFLHSMLSRMDCASCFNCRMQQTLWPAAIITIKGCSRLNIIIIFVTRFQQSKIKFNLKHKRFSSPSACQSMQRINLLSLSFLFYLFINVSKTLFQMQINEPWNTNRKVPSVCLYFYVL